ncbi:nicotinate-nucleotide--dimethylbenzimidazole phosphoribosyltransferase [Algicella marina]|uniref:Nicotinate-nucleotide--dimethylbenzimidazole phosphoribosyltransferase n=1 Tax=Algicella marina TaxID=2683284 RepID=A0A6P1SWE0_9RHOB|nr:nicotinate-nucleotide--dimethylbenzimidazole phosphoribosyltransferase [Algicella marina]QHQ33970.1 nicotinate-nucleotide--dimethylbenzimidazole phosphoribosyltransferase [Algicella marina]
MEFDPALREEVKAAIDGKTKPVGSLGRIEELAEQLCLLQGTTRPNADSCGLTIFAADHGLADAGVSAFPKAVTQQMVLNFMGGGAAANAFAGAFGVTVRVVDAGVENPVDHPNLLVHRLGPGTANSAEEPAMSPGAVADALDTGREFGASWGFPVVAFGDMGIGNTATCALLIHKITGQRLAPLVGPGTGLDAEGVARKLTILRKAASRTGKLQPMQALSEYGGFEIVMMAGAMIGAATERRLVLVDGFIASTAALIALTLEPELRPAFVFCHASAEPGNKALAQHLHAEPLLDLNLRLGEGTGALLAWPLVQAAAAMMNRMASFEDAGVSGAH